jgi:hypothetical protein
MLKLVRYRGRHAVTRVVGAQPARALAIVAVVVMALSVPVVARATTAPTGDRWPQFSAAGVPVLQDKPQVTVSQAGDNPEADTAAPAAAPTDAYYNGIPGKDGPWVILHPQVFLVFWGSWWLSSNSGASVDQSKTIAFFESLGGKKDHWSSILNQYYMTTLSDAGNSSVSISNSLGTYPVLLGGSAAAGSIIDPSDPPKHPTEDQMAAEAALAYKVSADAHYLSTGVIPIVVTPSGVESQFDATNSACGHHNWSYWLRDAGGGPHWNLYAWAETGVEQASYNHIALVNLWLGSCNWGKGTVGGLTSILSHEFAEAVTDPFPPTGTPYTDPGGQSWQGIGPAWTIGPSVLDDGEIGDACVGQLFPSNLVGGTWLQEIWSNAKHGCAKSA